jgi:hypothetical protein
MENVDLVSAAIAGDKEAFQAAFNDAIASKVSDALDVKKVEIASQLLTPETPEESNELETVEAEVGGSAESAEADTSVATEE